MNLSLADSIQAALDGRASEAEIEFAFLPRGGGTPLVGA